MIKLNLNREFWGDRETLQWCFVAAAAAASDAAMITKPQINKSNNKKGNNYNDDE